MMDSLSIARAVFRCTVGSIVMIVYLAMFGCGGKETGAVKQEKIHEQNPAAKVVGIELPNITPSSFNTPGELKAFVSVDGSELEPMALEDGNALVSFDGLVTGDHQLNIVFEHHSESYGVVTVATLANSFNISKGDNFLSITQDDYQIAGLDDDKDGVSNLAELTNALRQSSPTEWNNFPPEFVSEERLYKTENTVDPLAIAVTDANGHLLTYSIVGGADAKTFFIDPSSGYLRFLFSPDFESPSDQDRNNIYEVEISASDELGEMTSQLFLIEVRDVETEQGLQNLTLSNQPPAVLTTGEQLQLSANGSGNGVISFNSSDELILTVDDEGLLTAISSGVATISVSIAADDQFPSASISFSIEVIPNSFPLYGWVGKEGSELKMPDGIQGVEFYRTTDPQCDLQNYTSCANGKMDVLSGTDFFDTTAHLEQVAYYSFVKENKKAMGAFGGTKFSERSGHQAAVFNNKLWVIGGETEYGYVNDVWSSTDGVAWKGELKEAPFSARDGHQVVVFQNKLWLIGGGDDESTHNDVWSSADGVRWNLEQPSASFSPRSEHQVVVYKDELWLVGGGDVGSLNDVWRSSDGINWTEIASSAQFSARRGHQLVVFVDNLCLIGGKDESGLVNDVWMSDNGKDWRLTSTIDAYNQPEQHQSIVYDNKLWLFSGRDLSSQVDLWNSTDGVTWNSERYLVPVSTGNRQFVVFDKKMWVIGGGSSSFTNDIWSSQNGFSWWRHKDMFPLEKAAVQVVAFHDKLWLIGGGRVSYGENGPKIEVVDDIWVSSDGLFWEMVADSVPVANRYGGNVIHFNDTLFVFGGVDDVGERKDIWSSKDGISWKQEVTATELPSLFFRKFIEFQDKLWLFSVDENDNKIEVELWNSEDGISWTSEGVTVLPATKVGIEEDIFVRFELAVFANRLWLAGFGYDVDHGYLSAMWSTVDVVQWKEEAVTSNYPLPTDYKLFSYEDKLFIGGGFRSKSVLSNGPSELRFNDVWMTSDGVGWSKAESERELTPRSNYQLIEFQNQLISFGNETLKSNDGINWRKGIYREVEVK